MSEFVTLRRDRAYPKVMVSGYGEAAPGESLQLPLKIAQQVYLSAPNEWAWVDTAGGNDASAPVDEGIVEDFLGLTVSGLRGVLENEESVSFLRELMGREEAREHPRSTAIEAIGRRLNVLAPDGDVSGRRARRHRRRLLEEITNG